MAAETYRELVAARAGGACEYCRLLQAAAGVTFHLEHVVPCSQGGKTSLDNLALSCLGCNLAKAERTTGEDDNGRLAPQNQMAEDQLNHWLVLNRSSVAGFEVPGDRGTA